MSRSWIWKKKKSFIHTWKVRSSIKFENYHCMCKLYRFYILFLLNIDCICAARIKIFSMPCHIPIQFLNKCTAAVCLINVIFWANLDEHIEHTKGSFFTCTAAMCLIKWSSRPNLRGHKEHSKGFFFSCTAAICLSNCSLCTNLYGHKEHSKGLTCTAAMCLFKWSSRPNLIGHKEHSKGISCLCSACTAAIWFFKVTFWANLKGFIFSWTPVMCLFNWLFSAN